MPGSVRLSVLAKQDLDGIRDYTIERWGREQWLVYYRSIVDAFHLLQLQPEAGKDRSLFAPNLRSFAVKRHLIFYRFDENSNEMVIARIVHQRQNLPALIYHDDLLS